MEQIANKKYIFQFASNSIKKGICPKCKKGEFQYYKGLPNEYGKCERLNNCGYHNNPNNQNEVTKKELYNMVNNTIEKQAQEATKKIIVPSTEQLKVLENHSSVFHKFCIDNLGITKEHLQKWNIGTDTKANTAFVLQDITGRYLNIKFMRYVSNNNDCKRDKTKPPYYLKPKETEQYEKRLFGEHLLKDDKITCIVESEKTAVICDFKYPQFNWVATGGNNGVRLDVLSILKGRQVYYLADNDKAGNNNSIIDKLHNTGIDFEKVFFETAKDGEDLADLIIRGEHPEIKTEEIKKENTPLQIEIKTSTKNSVINESETFEKYGFFERNNQYYTKMAVKQSTKDVRISNFKMEIICKTNDGTDNAPILIELTRDDNKKTNYEITSKDLHNKTAFDALIFEGGYNFNGTSYVFKNILESLHDDSKISTYMTTLGQHVNNDFYAFYNGILTDKGDFVYCNDYGLLEYNNKQFYIPSAKKGNEELEAYSNDRLFKYSVGKLTLDILINKIFNIYGINGLVGLCYSIATMHRDIIFKETNFFPFIFLYGGKGSGKSTYINFFMNLFGEPQPETTENSTDKAIERKFSQINNNLQYIKEFSPTFEDKIKNILKNAYDGVGYSRAEKTQNNKTKTLTVKSGLIIDGNYFPTKDSALFSRLIFMIWEPKFTEHTKAQIQELQDILKNSNGLVFSEIYKQRNWFKLNFSVLYRETIKSIKAICKTKKILFSERELSHISILAVVFKTSIKLSESDYNLFLDTIILGTQKQVQINDSIDDVNKFFEALNTLDNNIQIREPSHFKREKGVDFDYIHINYNLCYFEYAKHLKQQGEHTIITSEELKQKLEFNISKEYYAETKKENYFTGKFGEKSARCFVFNVQKNGFELIK
jgi:hypothetical protein